MPEHKIVNGVIVPDSDIVVEYGIHRATEQHGYLTAMVEGDFRTGQTKKEKESAIIIAVIGVLVNLLRVEFGISGFGLPPVEDQTLERW